MDDAGGSEMALLVPHLLRELPLLLADVRPALALHLLDPRRPRAREPAGSSGGDRIHALCLQYLRLHLQLPLLSGDPAHHWLRSEGVQPQVPGCCYSSVLPINCRSYYPGRDLQLLLVTP